MSTPTLEGPVISEEEPTMSVFSPDRGGLSARRGVSQAVDLRKSMNLLAVQQRGRLSTMHLLSEELLAAAPSPSADSPDDDAIGVEAYVAESPPRGRHLLINMLTTHGDADDVGLTGIELFDALGRVVPVNPSTIFDSYDVPVSPVASTASMDDPRRNPANLFNGVNNTTDSTQMYLVPYTPGGHHIICVVFQSVVELAMLRLYNYNSDRVHTRKGAHLVEVTLDDEVAFRGYVAEGIAEICDGSTGRVHGIANCENVIFNDDPEVLKNVMAFTAETSGVPNAAATAARPMTPPNSAKATAAALQRKTIAEKLTMRFATDTSPPQPCAHPEHAPVVAEVVLEIMTTWGDENWVGMSDLLFENDRGEEIVVGGCCVDRSGCNECDAGPLPGDADVSALLDHDPSTAAVWSFMPGMRIVVTFLQPSRLGRIRVANYGLMRGTHCGAKLVRVYATLTEGLSDGGGGAAGNAAKTTTMTLLSPEEGAVLRKAPSNCLTLRFQSFDISATVAELVAFRGGVPLSVFGGGGGGGETAGAGAAPQHVHQVGVVGGGDMGAMLTTSMTASMTTRARIAMKRARMTLRDPPAALAAFQPYATPLLPVAYVFKFLFTVRCCSGEAADDDSHWASAVGGLDESGAELQPAASFAEADGLLALRAELRDRSEASGIVVKQVLWIFDTPVALSALFLRDQALAPAVVRAQYFADDQLIADMGPGSLSRGDSVGDVAGGQQLRLPGATGNVDALICQPENEAAQTTVFFTYDDAVLHQFFSR